VNSQDDTVFHFPSNPLRFAYTDDDQPDLTICTDLEVTDIVLFQDIYYPADEDIPY
jgi:hypothetical protein